MTMPKMNKNSHFDLNSKDQGNTKHETKKTIKQENKKPKTKKQKNKKTKKQKNKKQKIIKLNLKNNH
jgi:hypothetical protein